MGFPAWDNNSEQYKAYQTVQNAPHKAHLSHELIAAAASYEAAKAYQNHIAKQGKPTSHAKAKEIFAGLAGAAITRLVETKGLDAIDKHKAHQAANEHGHDHVY